MPTTRFAAGRWSPDLVAQWHELVRERSGLCFDASRIGRLLEGVEDRMAACGCPSPAEYWQRLQEEPAEFTALVSLLTVNETYFFRGMEELRIFADELFPEFYDARLRDGQEPRPISIVSAGCSSGEEPYSIAITLLERHGNSIPFMVHGGDVDGQALAVARSGLYGGNAFRSVDETLRSRYFFREASGRERIADHIRDKVDFFSFNLISADYPPALHGVDFIFYRNVSIYFDEVSKKTIFSRLMEHLTPGGALFFSPAEIFFHNQPENRPASAGLEDRQGRFFFRKHSHSVAPVAGGRGRLLTDEPRADRGDALLHKRSSDEARSVDAEKKGEKKGVAKASRLLHSGRYEKALAYLDLHLQEEPAHAQAAILKAALLLRGGDDREAIATAQALCRDVLARDSLSFAALVLLAMALHQEGLDPLERIDRLKAAVFLRPSSWLPHFYLAQTYELLDETGMASQEYQVVIYRLTQLGGFQDHGLPFLPLSYSAEQLIDFCHYRLKQMNQS
ncbi:MAG: protein-glutamate O-methyltransferase CheR [Magnetococcus sp. YQC-3]